MKQFGITSGGGFVALMIIGSVLIGFYEFLPDSATYADHLADNSSRVQIGAAIGMLAAVALLAFSGHLSAFLGERGKQTHASVALASGAVAAALIAVGNAAVFVAGQRVSAKGAIDPVEALVVNDLSSVLVGNAVPVALAALIGATVMAGTGILAPWLRIVSWVLVVALLIPWLSWIAIAPGLAWVALAGFLVDRSGGGVPVAKSG